MLPVAHVSPLGTSLTYRGGPPESDPTRLLQVHL